MNKRWVVLFFLVFFLLVITVGWKIYENKQWQYPRWEGTSQDGNWEAVLAKDRTTASSNTFFGNLSWKGDKKDVNKTYVTFMQFQVNGKYYAGDQKERIEKLHQIIRNPDNMGFLDWGGGIQDFEHKELIVVLKWKQNGEVQNTRIKLHRVFGP